MNNNTKNTKDLFLSIFCWTVLCSSIFLVTPFALAESLNNLAPNPGFEMPHLKGWVAQAKSKVSMDSTNPLLGHYCLKQKAVPQYTWNCVSMNAAEAVKVSPGKVYRLSIYGRNTLVGGGPALVFREIGAHGKTIRYDFDRLPAGQKQWKQYSFTQRPSKKTVAMAIYLYVSPKAKSGAAYWDNVSLTAVKDYFSGTTSRSVEVAPLSTSVIEQHQSALQKAKSSNRSTDNETNLALDPGFEFSGLKDWKPFDNNENIHIRQDASNPKAGKYSLKQPAVTNESRNEIWMKSIPLKQNMIYNLSVFGRNTLKGRGAAITLAALDAKGKRIAYYPLMIKPGQHTWKKYHLSNIRPNNNAKFLSIYLWVSPHATSGAAWWDQLRLTANPDPFAKHTVPGLQVAPIEKMPVIKQNGTTPEKLTLWTNSGISAVGGILNVTLSKSWANGKVASQSDWMHKLITISRQGPLPITIPVKQLPLGRYQLSLSFSNADHTINQRWNQTIRVLTPMPPSHIKPIIRSDIGPDGFLRVNGKPFIDINFYHIRQKANVVSKLRQKFGITTIASWGPSIDAIANHIKAKYQAGVYSWAVLFHGATLNRKTWIWKTDQLVKAVNRLKKLPGLIGYDLTDEPDGHGIAPDEVRRAAAIIRKHDPNHVIWVNLTGAHKDYAGVSDIASYDSYPFQAGSLLKEHKTNQAMIAMLKKPSPLLSVLQTYGIPGRGIPTPAQLRAEFYMDICDGMTMFHYYSWLDSPTAGQLSNNPQLQSEVRVLNGEAKKLKSFLFSPHKIKVKIKSKHPSALLHLAKKVDNHIEVVIVNITRKPVKRFTLSLSGQQITSALSRFDNGRRPNIKNGAIVDSLPPYGVLIYQVKVNTQKNME